jgi:GTP-binding protein EngB required for normal cell division
MIDLRACEALKFALADLLRAISGLVPPHDAASRAALRALFARLAEDRFEIALAGRFSRGKSSLMNAMLGMDRLPTGVVPLTSVITRVTYGSAAKVVLHYRGTSLFSDIPLAALAQAITERGNSGNRDGVEVAEVQLPAELLRRGVCFVDTPGLGSAIAANTATTEAYLPQADALLLVSSHDSPLSHEEAAMLERLAVPGRKVFLVVNKQDMVDDAARAEVRRHVDAVLAGLGLAGRVGVFAVSARDALAARLRGDPAALAASGLPALEAALAGFLLRCRHRAFLRRFCARIAALLAGLPPDDGLGARLAALCARIEGAETPAPGEARDPIPAALPGCEICAAIDEAMFGYFASYQHRLYVDAAAQRELAAAGGFCRLHIGAFQAIAASREAALAPVLEHQAARLRRLADTPPAPALIRRLLPDGGTCPACRVARRSRDTATAALAALAAQDGVAAVHARSALCLPHLAALAGRIGDPAQLPALVRRQAALMERMAEDARRLALKHDAGQQGATSGEEQQAPRAAARMLLGRGSARFECLPATRAGGR